MDNYLVTLIAKLQWIKQYTKYYAVTNDGTSIPGPWDIDENFLIKWPTPNEQRLFVVPILNIAYVGGENVVPPPN